MRWDGRPFGGVEQHTYYRAIEGAVELFYYHIQYLDFEICYSRIGEQSQWSAWRRNISVNSYK